MPDRVFCDKHDYEHNAKWLSGSRPLLDDVCYMCAVESLQKEIDRLKAELEEANGVIEHMEILYGHETRLKTNFERQLAEARAENERLKSPDYYACALCPAVTQAPQEAARTCINLVKRQAPPLIAHSITSAIKAKFGLEGWEVPAVKLL